jgi:hypothetical protein
MLEKSKVKDACYICAHVMATTSHFRFRIAKARDVFFTVSLCSVSLIVWLMAWDAVVVYRRQAMLDEVRRDLLCGRSASAWNLAGQREAIYGLWIVGEVMDAIKYGALPSSSTDVHDTKKLLEEAKRIGGATAVRVYAHKYKEVQAESRSWLPLP